ncbi:MAG: hypothetical protein Q7K33_03365 [Candidatus Berkelbacteria bacterium]|nr:hypothetical protein [Candidatus Berkelbacteria bacterium]
MTLVESQPRPEELFESAANPDSNIETTDFEYLTDETGKLINHWQAVYDEQKHHGWEDFRAQIAGQHLLNKEHAEKEYRAEEPEVIAALMRVNDVFGTLPAKIVDNNATILRNRQKNPLPGKKARYEERFVDQIKAGSDAEPNPEVFRQAAEWHADAIWSLLRFKDTPMGSDNRIGPNSGIEPSMATALVDLINTTFQKGYISSWVATSEASIVLSGLYGAVKAARIGHAARLNVSLPPSDWDTEGKIDMLFYLPLPSTRLVIPTQIKSAAKTSLDSNRLFEFDDGPPEEENPDKNDNNHKDWDQMLEYCEEIRHLPSWSKGVDIQPKWATIYGSQFDVYGWQALLGDDPDPEDIRIMQQSILRSVKHG